MGWSQYIFSKYFLWYIIIYIIEDIDGKKCASASVASKYNASIKNKGGNWRVYQCET